jgi:hypothetical protein
MTFFSIVGKIVYKTRWKVSFAREISALDWRLVQQDSHSHDITRFPILLSNILANSTTITESSLFHIYLNTKR